MTITLRSSSENVIREGNQAMAAYQKWRKRMVNRKTGLALAPREDKKKQEPEPTPAG